MSVTGDHSGWRVDDEAHFQHHDKVGKVVLIHGKSCIRVGWYLMGFFWGRTAPVTCSTLHRRAGRQSGTKSDIMLVCSGKDEWEKNEQGRKWTRA
jgi:hypothetical protein